MATPTFDEIIDAIKSATVMDLILNDPLALVLFNQMSTLLASQPSHTQVLTLAMLTACLHSIMDGEPCEYEKEKGVMITSEDRLRMFLAHYEVFFNDAQALKAHPDYPKRNKKDVM